MKPSTPLPAFLLVESQFVLRRTIASVAQTLGIASFKEATNNESARRLLASQRFDGVVIDLATVAAPFDLLAQLRHGQFASDADIAIVATAAEAIDGVLGEQLGSLGVVILRKPFKVGELLQMVQQLPVAAAAALADQAT